MPNLHNIHRNIDDVVDNNDDSYDVDGDRNYQKYGNDDISDAIVYDDDSDNCLFF